MKENLYTFLAIISIFFFIPFIIIVSFLTYKLISTDSFVNALVGYICGTIVFVFLLIEYVKKILLPLMFKADL